MASWVQTLLFMSILFPALVECKIRHYHFAVVLKNATKLCATKAIVTVNGKFPGPTLYAREGDNVLVRVTNHVQHNARGRQLRTGWSDGPAYITQCPIQPGQNFVYNFTLTGQRGTLLWHAHISWLRTTMHGAIVILPKKGVAYPFPKPDKEKVIVLGEFRNFRHLEAWEWWKADTEAVVNQAMQTGLPPNISDAHTINGRPGPVPNCSVDGISFGLYIILFRSEKRVGNHLAYKNNVDHLTELCHLVNADAYTLHVETIAYHNLTVVEVDAAYTKPYNTDTLFIGPGQTTTALLKADQGIGKYLLAISPFMDTIVAVDNVTGLGYLRYNRTLAFTPTTLVSIPSINATPVTSGSGFFIAIWKFIQHEDLRWHSWWRTGKARTSRSNRPRAIFRSAKQSFETAIRAAVKIYGETGNLFII
ncbi:hypothetical protein GQ457_14G024520 [Hibiscus cannabinus]